MSDLSGRTPSPLYESMGNVPPLVEPTYVVDRLGDVWRVVRNGGMVTRSDYGGMKSAGIEWLRAELGPLIAFDPTTYRREYLP